jgi:hypothetical protein
MQFSERNHGKNLKNKFQFIMSVLNHFTGRDVPYMTRAEDLNPYRHHIRTIFLYNRILMYIILRSEFSSKYDMRVPEIEVVPVKWFKTDMINWNLFFKFLPWFLSENCILLLHL